MPHEKAALARRSHITEEQERAQMLAIAVAVDALAVTSLTPVDCWYLSGLDQDLGPFPGTGTLKSE